MHAGGLFLLQCEQHKGAAVGELIGHTLVEVLNMIGQFISEVIFESISETFQGALEGMWNRINGRYW
jgi:hypothetical protein